MKATTKLLTGILGIILICSLTVSAQDAKFAHINSQKLMQAMPASDTAKAKFQKAQRDMQKQLEEMRVEMNRKYKKLQNSQDTLSKLVMKTKQSELQDMQRRIQEFQQTAQKDLQQKRSELFKPVYDKMNRAIEKVAQQHGFIYVFDMSSGAVRYHSEKSKNIMPLVKEELGLK